MRLRILILSVLLVSGLSCAEQHDENADRVIADRGTAPRIDGILEAGEWDDANTVHLDSTKVLRLKHDNEHLYLAIDGDGGTLYLSAADRLSLLHASFSLGSAEYSRSGDDSWHREREYEWELHGIQNEPEDEIRRAISAYLHRNGWVGSLMPMGTRAQTEFAVSFSWLGLTGTGADEDMVKTTSMFLSSCKNVPPSERKGSPLDRRFRWPPGGAPVDSLDRGYTPETISIDRSDWGEIYIRFGD